jgi:hypothetical protein
MSHFAKLDENNVVIQVIVLDNNSIINPETNKEDETIGINFCKSLYGDDTKWKQTSYNENFRGSFAGLGYFYDQTYDAFFPPTPYKSWIVDENTLKWTSPVEKPDTDEYFKDTYEWIEETQCWFSIEEYVYTKYAKDFVYSEIKDTVEKYGLQDLTKVAVFGNEKYMLYDEKVKNFLVAHLIFNEWNNNIAKKWLKEYKKNKYTLPNTTHFFIRYCETDKDKYIFKKFVQDYTDAIFLEEINGFIICIRNKLLPQG